MELVFDDDGRLDVALLCASATAATVREWLVEILADESEGPHLENPQMLLPVVWHALELEPKVRGLFERALAELLDELRVSDAPADPLLSAIGGLSPQRCYPILSAKIRSELQHNGLHLGLVPWLQAAASYEQQSDAMHQVWRGLLANPLTSEIAWQALAHDLELACDHLEVYYATLAADDREIFLREAIGDVLDHGHTEALRSLRERSVDYSSELCDAVDEALRGREMSAIFSVDIEFLADLALAA